MRLEIDGPLGPRLISTVRPALFPDWDTVADNLRTLGWVLDQRSIDGVEQIGTDWVYPLNPTAPDSERFKDAGFEYVPPGADYVDGAYVRCGVACVVIDWAGLPDRYLVTIDRRTLPEGADDTVPGVTVIDGMDRYRSACEAIYAAAGVIGARVVK